MACPDENTLVAFASGDLPISAASLVEEHLDGCAQCFALVAELARTDPDDSEQTRLLDVEKLPNPRAQPTANRPPPTQVGRYTVLHRIITDELGTIWAAQDRELGRRVALRLIDAAGPDSEQRRGRLLREAQAAAKVSHPNVLAVHDSGASGDQVYIATELLDARPLGAWLRERQRTWSERLDVVLQVARGVAAAHAAGLLHRDLKPDNVLVDGEGRARLIDFGLARAASYARDEAPTMVRLADPDAPESLEQPWMQGGYMLGTPAYMAPELYDSPGDARSDQFALCVLAFEVLFARRPWPVVSARAMRAAVTSGQAPVLEPRMGVPRWLGHVIVRGLDSDPRRRHPTVAAFVEAIEGGLAGQRKLRQMALGGAAAAVIAVLVTIVAFALADHDCDDAIDRLAVVWNPARADAIEAGMRRVDAPFAGLAAGHARTALDAYAARWTDAAAGVCTATDEDDDAATRRRALQLGCLDRRLADLAAIALVHALPDRALVEHSHRVIDVLTPVSVCDGRDRGEPDDPKRTWLQAKAVGGDAMLAIGDPGRAAAIAAQIGALGRELGDPAVVADARRIAGLSAIAGGDIVAGMAELERAMQSGVAVSDARAFVRAAAAFARAASEVAAADQRALQAATLGRAALARTGTDLGLEIELLRCEGTALRGAGRLTEAEAAFADALALQQRSAGADDPAVADRLEDLGAIRLALGDEARGLTDLERAATIRGAWLGADHPEVADGLERRATALAGLERLDQADADLRAAIALRTRISGAEDPRIADAAIALGELLVRRGRLDDALEQHRQALAIREAAFGASDPAVGNALAVLGHTLVALGRWDEADAALARALKIARDRSSSDELAVAAIQFDLGRVAHGRGRWGQALSELEGAMAVRRRVLDPRDPAIGIGLLWIARTHRDAGNRSRAIAFAEEALAVLDAARDPDAFTQARLVVADVLWLEGERARARAEVESTKLVLQGLGSAGAPLLATLRAWQSARTGGDDPPTGSG